MMISSDESESTYSSCPRWPCFGKVIGGFFIVEYSVERLTAAALSGIMTNMASKGLPSNWREKMKSELDWYCLDNATDHDNVIACMKAHDRLVDDAGDDASTGNEAIFTAFWAALRLAVSKGTYDAIVDDYCSQRGSWRELPMIASGWVWWL